MADWKSAERYGLYFFLTYFFYLPKPKNHNFNLEKQIPIKINRRFFWGGGRSFLVLKPACCSLKLFNMPQFVLNTKTWEIAIRSQWLKENCVFCDRIMLLFVFWGRVICFTKRNGRLWNRLQNIFSKLWNKINRTKSRKNFLQKKCLSSFVGQKPLEFCCCCFFEAELYALQK